MRKFRVILPALALLLLPLSARAAQTTSGEVYCFSAEDFALGAQNLTGLCITSLPQSEGTVMLGERTICTGDILTAEQVAQLTFYPTDTELDTDAQMGYLPVYDGSVGGEAALTIAIRGKQDKAPVAEDSALETYKNLSNTGALKVSDPEGKSMTFTVVRQPKRGVVTLSPDGSFTYTPKKNKIGVDSFTYTATDEAGNVSREATVTVTILKPTDSERYADTAGESCRFTAEWMKNTGIFTGETLGGISCFQPEKTVTTGEFLTMLVKTLELPVEEDTAAESFASAPSWLRPYLAAASRAGLTAALPSAESRSVDEAIPSQTATALVCAALGTSDAAEAGITVPESDTLARADAARLLYELSLQTDSGRPTIWS